jgi:hypothetical protein
MAQTRPVEFTIYDVTSAGSVVAGPQTNSAVGVSNGLFTVALDFGAVFNGAARWLEIGVRPGGSASDFTTLTPRQPISPTPYAMFATTAGTVPNGAITAAKLAAGAAAANLSAGGQSAVGGGGVVLSEQFNATELTSAGFQKIGRVNLIDEAWLQRAGGPTGLPAPLARRGHSAVWTGDEMLVWGGTDLTSELNTGGRYNRAANTWSAISTNNAPSPRTSHTAVWDGTRMIVWRGSVDEGFLNSGGIYNPLTDGWLPTQLGTNAPPARALHAAVWTGTEMVIHGGFNSSTFSTTYLDDTWH